MKLTPERRQIESGEYPLAKTLSGISFPDEPISCEAIYSKNPPYFWVRLTKVLNPIRTGGVFHHLRAFCQ